VVALLVVAIGVLALVGLLVVARSRFGTDPSSSVAAFNRALTAMEPGSGHDRSSPKAEGGDAPAPDRARPAR
jgi:hypothetical protein